MTKPINLLLLIGTLAPFAAFLIFFIWMLGVLLNLPPEQIETALQSYYLVITLANIGFTIVFGLLHVFYIVHAAKNPNLEAMRVTWIIGLVILGFFVMPFYWFHHIWRDDTPSGSSGPLGINS